VAVLSVSGDRPRRGAPSAGSSFHYSFGLMPRERRRAIETVYAFCRYVDDLADEGLSGRDAQAERGRGGMNGIHETRAGSMGTMMDAHSKDRRDGDPQVVVGLALTRDGLPVRSWVFPGNTVDATTVAQVKADLRGWKLGRAIFVGDAGMDSEANRRELAKGLGHYILAMPIGKLKEVQEEVLARPGRFRVIHDTLEVKEVVVGTGERRRRYIVCRNQEEAKRQRHHREEILTALKVELAPLDPDAAEHSKRACELVASARYGRYLTRGPGGRLAIDADAVRAAERLDGKYVLLTNDDTLTPEDVGLGYKSMMIIEACFRRMKTTGLRIRPVYHWTAHRIVSHVKLCVLALLIERAAELRTGETWRNLRLALDELKAVRYQVQGTTIVQSTRPTPQVAAILKKLKISPPSLVLASEKPSSASPTT